MANPPPNRCEGETSKLAEEAHREFEATAQKTFIATPASQLPSKLQFVAVGAPGPSGIKQCFRTVKAARRVPTLPRRDAEPERRARRDRAKRHICPDCNKRFPSPGKLTQHALSHTGELPFSCDLCDKRFNTKFKLVRHGLIHSEARAFGCPTCGKSFNRKDHLNNHIRGVHNPEKKMFTCEKPECRKTYTSHLSYRKHAALHSAEEGNLQCMICDEVFKTREDIVYHLKVHTGSRAVKNDTDKKFTCNYCERRFFTAKDVRRHLVVHTGSRDFLCYWCPQKFGRKDHLVRHVKNAHPDETWRPIAETSGDTLPEETPGPSTENKQKDAPPTEVTLKDEFGLQLEGFMWNHPQSTSSKDSASEGGPTRVPSSDIIVDMPNDFNIDIKLEPLESSEIELEQPTSPVCEYSVGTDYPVVYVVPSSYQHPPPDLPYITTQPLPTDPLEAHLLDSSDVQSILMDPGEGPSGLSSQILRGLLEDSDSASYPAEEGRIQRLPAFTQAFQSTQIPKPPPQPPPPH